MSSSDEDDKFLYGSDEEKRELVSSKRVAQGDDGEGSLNKRQKVSNEENTGKESSSDLSQGEESDSNSSESESDSDVEFIISTGTDSTRLDSGTASGAVTSAAQPSGITLATSPVEPAAQVIEDGTPVEAASLVPPKGTIDLNADGMYEGEPVTSLDPEVLKEKPWRQPGANTSDYFNYGFNEFTWMEYLHKQDKLQQEYNPHKILMGLLTLQQQGNLNGPKNLGNPGDMNNSGGIKTNTQINQHVPGRPMMTPGFPPLPMFGGFPPFSMPGMMPPMNQQQKK